MGFRRLCPGVAVVWAADARNILIAPSAYFFGPTSVALKFGPHDQQLWKAVTAVLRKDGLWNKFQARRTEVKTEQGLKTLTRANDMVLAEEPFAHCIEHVVVAYAEKAKAERPTREDHGAEPKQFKRQRARAEVSAPGSLQLRHPASTWADRVPVSEQEAIGWALDHLAIEDVSAADSPSAWAWTVYVRCSLNPEFAEKLLEKYVPNRNEMKMESKFRDDDRDLRDGLAEIRAGAEERRQSATHALLLGSPAGIS